MKKQNFKTVAVYIIAAIVGIITIVAAIWQIKTPSADPLDIMYTLCIGGIISCSIVGFYRLNNKKYSIAEAERPFGVSILWMAIVILGIGIWSFISSGAIVPVCIALVFAILFAIWGFVVMSDK